MKCLNPHCQSKTVFLRGLCQGCYRFANGLVATNLVSWEMLERNGKALKTEHGNETEAKKEWFLKDLK